MRDGRLSRQYIGSYRRTDPATQPRCGTCPRSSRSERSVDEPVTITSDRSRSQLDRVDRILDAFDPGHTSLTLLGLVARTGLPKTTVYRTVRKMAALGWVEYRDGRYSIGARLFERATLAGGHLALRDTVLPFLQELCAATRETASLALLDGCDVLYLEKLVGRRPVPTLSRV